MDTVPHANFVSMVEITDSDPPWHILRVKKSLVADFGFKGNLRRVMCSLNGCKPFNCSLFPGKGDYFLTLSKQLRKSLGVEVGDVINVDLQPDTSKFGMPMPEEFAEVLRQDADGEKLFNALSPCDQRLMLKLVVFVKDPDRRIIRGLTGIDLLKRSDGKFVYSEQHLAMRIAAGSNIRLERRRPD